MAFVSCKFVRTFGTAARAEPLAVSQLPRKVAEFINEKAKLCQPTDVHICDGSEAEYNNLLKEMEQKGMVKRLSKLQNCWLSRTDPADVARVESKTFISTPSQRETVPLTQPGVKSILGNWMAPEEMDKQLNQRFPNCMKGRKMYVIPFSMGPVGSPLSKIGIELTDSPYVVASMRIMTRMGENVMDKLSSGNEDFVRCLHSVGRPLPMAKAPIQNWPCNPSETLIAHIPERNEICSYGSGYGGNSLLGKKCLALRLGSILARREGFLAEHMLILGITPPSGKKHYIAAAFPSACGKTNLAMLQPTLPGYKIECVGDDIAWMRFDSYGRLRAINPERGFFGVAPGTSNATNPIAMATVQKDTIFTNTAETSDGSYYWEGLEKETPGSLEITDWQGKPWKRGSKTPAAHPNSRFCSPATNCPSLDPAWESSEGVPIDAILFGGRRPSGFPLVIESYNWDHGVLYGSSMRSEATAAAEHKGNTLMHDPFAMRPFFGYNVGHYIEHWLSLPHRYSNAQLPKIFKVNWFRRDAKGGFLWPGFGENSRVIDWIIRRVENDDTIMEKTPIGYIPRKESFNLNGLKESIDWKQLFSVPKDFWLNESEEVIQFLHEQLGADLPPALEAQLARLRERLATYEEPQ